VDGQEIVDSKSYEHGPAPAKVECPEFAVEGGGMALTIFLPPLPVGDHQVTWQVIFAADMNDGWADYTTGTMTEFMGTVRVPPTTLPQTGGAINLIWALMGIVSGGLALLAGLGLRRRR